MNINLDLEPEYIVIDEYARVFSGFKLGRYYFSENIDDAKPLRGQDKFNHLKRYIKGFKIEQMFLESKSYGRKKRIHNKT